MRSGVPALLAGAIATAVFGVGIARAQVSPDDIAAAEAEVTEAAQLLAEAQAELQTARAELDVLQERLLSLDDQRDELSRRREEVVSETRSRVARLYMTVGDGVIVGDPADLSARIAYLVAVAQGDVDSVNRLLAQRADLERLLGLGVDDVTLKQEELRVLEMVVAARAAALGHAEGSLGAVREQYRAQEEERRRREEEEQRRREEEEQRRIEEQEEEQRRLEAALEDARENARRWGYTPGAGTEQWRPLVEQYFPSELVADALAVIACESHGDPFATNPFTGAGGLFQHLPFYWPMRAAEVGFAGTVVYHPEANVAASAWLVQASLDGGEDAWAHWSCRP